MKDDPTMNVSAVTRAIAAVEEEAKCTRIGLVEAGTVSFEMEPGEVSTGAQIVLHPGTEAPPDADAFSGPGSVSEATRQQVKAFFWKQLHIRIGTVRVFGDESNVFVVNYSLKFSGHAEFQSWGKWRMFAIAGGYVPNVEEPREWELALADLYRMSVSRRKGSANAAELRELLTSLWEKAIAEQTVHTGQGEEIVRRRTFALEEWGWYRDEEEIVIAPKRFAERYRESNALYPVRATKMLRLALNSMKARKVPVAVTESTKRCLAITLLREEV